MNFRNTCAAALIALLAAPFSAGALELPTRKTPAPDTTPSVPHVQIGVTPDPAIHDELLHRVTAHPGIEIRPTIISQPGALGFWITGDHPLARGDMIIRGREFAHLHPDGSLHATLSPELAGLAVKRGWAIPHPWSGRPGWGGFVLIYTPTTEAEMEIVHQLIVAGYEFVLSGEPGAAGPPLSRPPLKAPDSSRVCTTC